MVIHTCKFLGELHNLALVKSLIIVHTRVQSHAMLHIWYLHLDHGRVMDGGEARLESRMRAHGYRRGGPWRARVEFGSFDF